MKTKRLDLLLFFTLLSLFSCHSKTQEGKDLDGAKIEFIKSLGLLNEDETIVLFESHGGFKSKENNGNFITNKRLASYWIEEDHLDESSIKFAFYSQIDTIVLVDLSKSLTYSSYLNIATKSEGNFKLYIGLDQKDCALFYAEALKQWQLNKNL